MEEDVRAILIKELDAVYRLAYHLSSRPQDVDDLVQETYLRAFRAADRFQLTEVGPKPWLFKILYNLVCSHYDTKKRESSALSQLPVAEASSLEPACIYPDLAHLNWDLIDERLKMALDNLTLTARTTFLLCAVEGLKYREIAKVTEVPEGTVMSRLYRARTELVAQLGDYAIEQGWIKAGPANHAKEFKLARDKDVEPE